MSARSLLPVALLVLVVASSHAKEDQTERMRRSFPYSVSFLRLLNRDSPFERPYFVPEVADTQLDEVSDLIDSLNADDQLAPRLRRSSSGVYKRGYGGDNCLQDMRAVSSSAESSTQAVWWTVIRRYKEFEAFDVQYFTDRSKSFLPPKRIVGNMNADFLEERRRELETYLTTVLEMDVFQQKKNGLSSLSFVLAKFLDFHQYEVHAIVEDLSERLGRVGDSWLSRSEKAPKYFEFTPVDLHAIHVRLQLAEPTHPDSKPNLDVAHTVEFLQRVKSVKIRGTRGGGYLGSSNILANQLPFSLAFCKNLLALWDLLVDAESGVQPLNSRPRWTRLEDADFSFNQLTRIDESIIVLRTLTKLNLSHNALKSIDSHLQHLPFLATLDLSHNAIEDVKDWHEKLGNIKNLNLSSNNIRDIEGLSRLLSLETLDVSSNSLSSLAAIASMGRLPCLDVLLLRANPIRKMVDYRTKVLEVFGRRAAEVKLDSRRPDSREMDTINVRLALRQAREEREEQLRLRQLSIDERIRYISGGPLDSEAKSL